MSDPTHTAIIKQFDNLPVEERERARERFEQYRRELIRIGYTNAEQEFDPMVRAAELASVAVALGGDWEAVLNRVADLMLPSEANAHGVRGAASSLALMWMGSSQDVPK